MKWMCASMPPAVRIIPSPAIASVVTPTTRPSVTPAITSGFPALPMPAIRPPLIPTSALRMPVQSTISALVISRGATGAALLGHGTVRQGIPTANHPAAGNLDQRDRLRLARLEADGGSGGNIQPEPVRRAAIERERAIGLDEVIVAADLDRPIAAVDDGQRPGGASFVEHDRCSGGTDRAGQSIERR